MLRIAVAIAATAFFASAASAMEPAMTAETSLGTVYVDQNGMTLYTFDKDQKGATVSACVDQCIKNWPPFLAAEGAMAAGAWSLVSVTDADGTVKQMWAHDGWPLYLFVKDGKPGDVVGDGVNGVWHAAKPSS
jgi:predicted lipoprotein with Yx(FWY)xxD motif